MRYRFYREHKFVIPFINEVTRLIANTDFSNDAEFLQVKDRVEQVTSMMKYHAEHEDIAFHSLLKEKGSTVHEQVEEDHREHIKIFAGLKSALQAIEETPDNEEKIRLGYDFYLTFREFEAENMKHINTEERVIMPELQLLYSDDELRAVEAKTYEQMTPDQMVHMLQVIFPYMDVSDRRAFLTDIAIATPEKIKSALCGILNSDNDKTGEPIIPEKEAKDLLKRFSVTEADLIASGVPRRLSYLWEGRENAEIIETSLERKGRKSSNN